MTVFWIAAAALSVAVAAALLLPLLRRAGAPDVPSRAQFDLTVYKDQLAEVDRDLERGVLSADQALAARTEIERRMLAAAGDGEAEAKAAPQPKRAATRVLMALIALAVPAGALGLYLLLGQPGLEDQPLAQRQQQETLDTASRAEKLDAMAAELRASLEKEPNAPRNWAVLAQIYEMQGDLAAAVGAYGKLAETSDRHPEALIALAEAQIALDNEMVSADVAELLKEAKAKDPAHPKPYFYLAMERRQKEDLKGALDEYTAMLAVTPEDAPWVEEIQSRVAQLAGELKIETPAVKLLPPSAPQGDQQGAPGPTAEQVQDAQQMAPEDQQAMIRSMVERLATRLQENPDDLAGWQRLAQAYRVLGEDAKAAEAEAQIKRLGGQ